MSHARRKKLKIRLFSDSQCRPAINFDGAGGGASRAGLCGRAGPPLPAAFCRHLDAVEHDRGFHLPDRTLPRCGKPAPPSTRRPGQSRRQPGYTERRPFRAWIGRRSLLGCDRGLRRPPAKSRRRAGSPGRGDPGDPQGLERGTQPALRWEALPAARRPLGPGPGSSDRDLARRDRPTGSQAGGTGGRRLGAFLPWRSAEDRRYDPATR